VALMRRVGMSVVFVIILFGLALNFWNRREPIAVDYHTYVAAARVGVDHGFSQIYNQSLVAIEQMKLVGDQVAQPFLSPPTVAWMVTPLLALPYWVSYYVWELLTLVALLAALWWASTSRGMARWIGVAGALFPWWTIHSLHVGQVVPWVAVAIVVAWRLLREKREIATGLVLCGVLLKPNTAFLAPLVVLAAGYRKAFAASAVGGAVIGAVALLSLGFTGTGDYISQVTGPLPAGADNVTLEGAFGVSGMTALALRVLIVVAALFTAYRLRRWPAVVLGAGAVGSLLVTPYIHASDLCVFAVAAWMIWEEHPLPSWRVPIGIGWFIAGPFVALTWFEPTLRQWPLLELALFVPLVAIALLPRLGEYLARSPALTGEADLRTQGPA